VEQRRKKDGHSGEYHPEDAQQVRKPIGTALHLLVQVTTGQRIS
jgi:hypothetical protein